MGLSWVPNADARSYQVEAGSASGAANLFNANVGGVLSLSTLAPAGNYFTRVRAVNGCGQHRGQRLAVNQLRRQTRRAFMVPHLVHGGDVLGRDGGSSARLPKQSFAVFPSFAAGAED